MSASSVSDIGFLLNPERYRANRFKDICSKFVSITEKVFRDSNVLELRFPYYREALALIPEICSLAIEISTISDPGARPELRLDCGEQRAARFLNIFTMYLLFSDSVLSDPRVTVLGLPESDEALSLIPELCSLGKLIHVIPEPNRDISLWLFRHGEWVSQ
jgi:hypothetical protein